MSFMFMHETRVSICFMHSACAGSLFFLQVHITITGSWEKAGGVTSAHGTGRVMVPRTAGANPYRLCSGCCWTGTGWMDRRIASAWAHEQDKATFQLANLSGIIVV